MTEQYDFDSIVDRTDTQSVKLECLPPQTAQPALPLWVADMDFPCAAPILEALHQRVDRAIFGYSLYQHPQVLQAVTGWFQRRFGWQINPETVVFSPGVVPAIAFLLQILTEPGDGVLVQQPVYYPFMAKIENSGRRVVNNPLRLVDGRYEMDLADLEAKLADPANKGLILCSPHNPVGRVWTAQELQQVVALASRYDKWIIADEIHCDLIRAGHQHHPLLQLCPDQQHRIIACTAPSKTFNLAGLQISNIMIPNAQWRQQWNTLVQQQYSLQSANPFGLVAMMAGYNQGEPWLNQVNSYIDGNVAYCREVIAQQLPKARWIEPEGTYLLWVDVRAYCDDASRLEAAMLAAGLVLDEGYIFGEAGRGFERINLACPRSVLAQCLERMVAVLQQLDNKAVR